MEETLLNDEHGFEPRNDDNLGFFTDRRALVHVTIARNTLDKGLPDRFGNADPSFFALRFGVDPHGVADVFTGTEDGYLSLDNGNDRRSSTVLASRLRRLWRVAGFASGVHGCLKKAKSSPRTRLQSRIPRRLWAADAAKTKSRKILNPPCKAFLVLTTMARAEASFLLPHRDVRS